MNIKNAVLYLRVSTEEQVENFSLGTQEEICRREAKFKGYKVVKVFREEGRSAKSMKGRIVLIEMLEYCRKNKNQVEAVMIYKTDRLSRQTFDYLIIQRKLSDMGVKLLSATEPTDDSPMGKFLGSFFAQIAQFDNDMRSERAKNGMYARFKLGLYTCGHPPCGYVSINGMVVKDPKKFDLLKKAWEIMATGTKSISEMNTILEKQGLKMAKSALHRTFRNKFYMGIQYSPTYNEEVQGQHLPMISKNLFEKVQDLLDGRRRNNLVNLARRDILNADFPLRRFIQCGKCGLRFTGAWSKYHQYPYYFCRERKACQSVNVPRKHIHEELNILLKTIIPTKEGKQIFLFLLEREYHNRSSKLHNRKARRALLLKKLQDMKAILIQNHLLGVYSNDVFKEQLQLIDKNIQSINLSRNDNYLNKYTLSAATKYVEGKLNDFTCTYDQADLSQKRSLLGLLFPNGFTWHYPGLSYNQLNPLFREIS